METAVAVHRQQRPDAERAGESLPGPLSCLSVPQPRALGICLGVVEVENRPWCTAWRGTLAIHASGSRTEVRVALRRVADRGWDAGSFDYGAIIGVADLADCVPLSPDLEADIWATGPMCWKLANGRRIARPIPLKGRGGLFSLPPEVAAELADQLQRSPPAADREFAEDIARMLRLDPPDAAIAQAASYLAMQRFDAAVRAATRAIEHDPACGRAYYVRAIARGELGLVGAAIDDAERAIACGWTRSGELSADAGNLAAIYHAAEALRAHPDPPRREEAGAWYARFAQLANIDRRDAAAARRGYAAHRRYDAASAIRAYAIRGSALDQLADLQRMAADAIPAGLDRASVENLRFAILAAQAAQAAQAVRRVNAALDRLF